MIVSIHKSVWKTAIDSTRPHRCFCYCVLYALTDSENIFFILQAF